MWQTVHARYSSMRHEVPAIVAEGDKVAVQIRAFFRKRSNDRIVQFDIAVFFTLRDGRVTQIREIMDSFDLVQQVLERDVAAVLAESKPGKAVHRRSGRSSANPESEFPGDCASEALRTPRNDESIISPPR